MAAIMECTIVSVRSDNRLQIMTLKCNKLKNYYIISRVGGMFGGKMISHPEIKILQPKQSRTLEQQAELQFNSMLKKYLDKGYKKLDDLELPDDYTENDIIGLIGSATDAKGAPKPMLCKKYEDVKSTELDKDWWISKKIDGLRGAIFQKNGIIHSSSRGGSDYDLACKYIFADPHIKKIFEIYPDIILDAEIYKHGFSLQRISGLCRLEEEHEDHKKLYLCCYDLMDESKTFEERYAIIKTLKELCKNSSKIEFVEHYPVKGLDAMMQYHDRFIQEGYEGAVIRRAESKYKFGSRSSNWLKIKQMVDNEYIITGITEGLRDEDFVFNLVTDDGKPFEAKPTGTREERQEYRDNINNIIGKKGTVKHFGFTPDGKPNLPIFKNVVNEKDR